MYVDQFIGIADNAASDDLCDNIVRFFKKKIDNVRHVRTALRDDYALCEPEKYQSFMADDAEIFDMLDTQYREYHKQLDGMGLPSPELAQKFVAPYKLQRASKGGGFYGWHSEQGPGAPKRFLTWMLYLNDVHATGSTEFLYQKIETIPRKGTLVIWPAAFTHIHRSNPNLQEDKYIATGWWNLREL